MAKVVKVVRTVKTTRTKVVRTVKTTKHRQEKPNGVILYRGPSLLDGMPIVVVATGLARPTKNEKTGDMVQTYVLYDGDEDPIAAIKLGLDKAVCGECPHRGTSCYVNPVQAPLSVWRGVKRGIYPAYKADKHAPLFAGRFVRLGSYGDPAAVPLEAWEEVAALSAGWTGYTHQWETCDKRLARLCMASVDTPRQREKAMAAGWRTFRVRLESQAVERGEFVCPASEEAGKIKSCEECRACNGSGTNDRRATPVIRVHGPSIANNWKKRMFEATVGRLQAEERKGLVGLPMTN